MNQHSEVLDFDDGCKVCFHTKRQRGGIHLNIRNMFESWGCVQGSVQGYRKSDFLSRGGGDRKRSFTSWTGSFSTLG